MTMLAKGVMLCLSGRRVRDVTCRSLRSASKWNGRVVIFVPNQLLVMARHSPRR